MDVKELLAIQLDSGQALLTAAAEALTEDEFHAHLPGPGPSANWIFGHLAVNEDWFLSLLSDQKVQLPKDLADRYQGDLSFAQEVASTSRPSQAAGLGKQEIVDLFVRQRQRTRATLQASDPSGWHGPLPEGIPAIYKSLGGVWGIVAVHQYWHLGQLMSIRNMLKKPPLQM